jgi:hypothetical protein
MEAVSTLDSFLIARIFSPIAWFIERHTGRNNFRQAIILCWASAVSMVVWLAIFKFGHWWLEAVLSPVACFWLWLCHERTKIIQREATLAEIRPEIQQLLNQHFAPLRVMTLAIFLTVDSFLTSIDIPDIHHAWEWVTLPSRFYSTIFAVALYIAAVPRPPARPKKERDWFWFLRPMPVPT